MFFSEVKICLYCPIQCYCNLTQVNTERLKTSMMGVKYFVSKNHFVALMLE